MTPTQVKPHATATPIFYKSGKNKGWIFYWESNGRCYWSALGNDGSEDNEEDALEAAKRWIRREREATR